MSPAGTTKENGASVPERRKEVRVPIDNVTVEVYTPQGVPASREVCDMVNISVGGMLFRALRPYDIGQMVRLTFTIQESPAPVHAGAKVVHWHVAPNGKFVGVQFGDLGVSERMAVEKYVKRMQDD